MINNTFESRKLVFNNNYSMSLNKAQKGFVTDNLIINKDTSHPMLPTETLPDDLVKQDHSEHKSSEKALLKIITVPLAVLGIGAAVTGLMSGRYKNINIFKSKLKEVPAPLPRLTQLTKETEFATFSALRDPSKKNILGAMAVFAVSSAAFVLKNTVDGIKEIWVKQKEAGIKKNYQEKMIDIETRSFSGKKQIIRYMLNDKEKDLESFNNANNIAFSSNSAKDKDDEGRLKPIHVLIGAAAVAASALMIKHTLKNIRHIGEKMEQFAAKKKSDVVESLIGSKNTSEIGKKLADAGFIEAEEVEKAVKKTRLSSKKQKELTEKLTRRYAEPPDYFGERGKVAYTPNLNDISGHVYNAIVHPDKFTTKLFLALTTLAGVSYAGTKFVEGNKEVQVKKREAEIDLNMNEQLVKVQLKNFMTKKESAVNPLILDYKAYAKSKASNKDVLKTSYNNIFEEIKNGPPFVYD